MSEWGRATYGDPCRECGYGWPRRPPEIIAVVRDSADKLREALAGSDGTRRSPALAWDARGYVCHVADNLRIWAERLVAAVEVTPLEIGTYDADLLAEARNYGATPLPGALWSLQRAVDGWLAAIELAERADVVLLHPDRGRLALVDVMSTNAHDAFHHLYDVRRLLAGRQPGRA